MNGSAGAEETSQAPAPEATPRRVPGKTRLILLFAEAHRAIEPFLCRVPPPPADQPLFSPQRAEGARSVVRRGARRTRVQPSQAARQAVATADPLEFPR